MAAGAVLAVSPLLVLEIAGGADASTDVDDAMAVIVEATPVDVTLPSADDAPELLATPPADEPAPKTLAEAPGDDGTRFLATYSGGDALRAEAEAAEEEASADEESTEEAATSDDEDGVESADSQAAASSPPTTAPPATTPPTTAPPTTAPPTTAPPTTAPPTTAPPTTAAPAPSTSGPTAEQWAALRQCEASGSYTAVNPIGYYGAYQFSISTWDWVASIHAPHLQGVRPDQASPADQDAMALYLYGMNGAAPWPHCGVHLR